MGWKREQFKRRIRELTAANRGEGRAYMPVHEAENDIPHSIDHVWQCLSKAWNAGRAMGKSPLTLQDEAEEWLSDLGVPQARIVGQAFIDTRAGDRIWNSKCEMCRFELANVTLNASERGAESGIDELRHWYSDIVAEWADLYKTKSLSDANHAMLEWAETEAILPKLWSLYDNGPRTIGDRKTLKGLVVAITNVSNEQAEAWIYAEEKLRSHSSEVNESPK